MRKKILFIDREQFGYLTDSFKYCEYLGDKCDIEYLCFNKGFKKMQNANIKISYIPYYGPKPFRALLFFIFVIFRILTFRGFIFILYFPKCMYLKKILFWKKMHLDIRTLAVAKDENARIAENKEIEKTINLFDSLSIINLKLLNYLNITKRRVFELPLGADQISKTNKSFEHISLLYMGTLTNRDILKTVKGTHKFIMKYPNSTLQYTIIGNGEDYGIIEEYINANHLNNRIKLVGALPYDELKGYLDNHNIGVSFVPITKGYNFQPPTKSYEYILSGLFCIATGTDANKEIINSSNGIIIFDSSNAFFNALEYIQKNINLFNSDSIRRTLVDFQWENLIHKYFIPILDTLS